MAACVHASALDARVRCTNACDATAAVDPMARVAVACAATWPCRHAPHGAPPKCDARSGQHGDNRVDWPEPPRRRERRGRVVQRAHRRFAGFWRSDGHNAAWNTGAKPTSAWSLLVVVRGGWTGWGSGGCESDPDRADASSFMVDANMPPLAGSAPVGVPGRPTQKPCDVRSEIGSRRAEYNTRPHDGARPRNELGRVGRRPGSRFGVTVSYVPGPHFTPLPLWAGRMPRVASLSRHSLAAQPRSPRIAQTHARGGVWQSGSALPTSERSGEVGGGVKKNFRLTQDHPHNGTNVPTAGPNPPPRPRNEAGGAGWRSGQNALDNVGTQRCQGPPKGRRRPFA